MAARRLNLLLSAASALLLLCGSAVAATPAGSQRARAAASNPVALGVTVDGTAEMGGEIDAFRSLTGAQPAIIMWYQGFDQHLYRPDQLAAVTSRGAIPEITWDPVVDGVGVPLQAISTGRYDAYLRQSANLAATWRGPLFIRFAPEMNLPSSAWGPMVNGNTPAAYVAAWRHVVQIFRNAGAINVRWIWSPDQDCDGRCPFTTFYPGDAWVDWLGLDGYNGGPALGAPWVSFAQEFANSYAAITRMSSRPLMIAETGSGEAGGSKAQWIDQAFLDAVPAMPRIRAVTWFNHNKETDWRVNSSPSALAAFRTVMHSPLYREGGTLTTS